jgi:hypothetical protein
MRNLLTFEQYGDEYYILLGDDLYGRIVDMGNDNFYIIWEDDNTKVPEHGLDNAKQYAQLNFKDHEPV